MLLVEGMMGYEYVRHEEAGVPGVLVTHLIQFWE